MILTRSQKGMSMLSWMIMLAVVAFLASTMFKMAPHYLDYSALEKIIVAVETDKVADVRTVGDFYAYVRKGMSVNSISDIDIEKALKVTLNESEFRVHLKYENREPLIQNLDLVARFDKEFRVRMP